MKNSRARVLVVEDSASIRSIAVGLVQSAGYEALEAEDAEEAIHILQTAGEIDLVFTDVQMPGTMDGVGLSHYIRGRWPLVKIIVASGAADLTTCSLPEGCKFFAKPYRCRSIVDEMARLLSTSEIAQMNSGQHSRSA